MKNKIGPHILMWPYFKAFISQRLKYAKYVGGDVHALGEK